MSLFLFTILTGLVDCLNPSTIITQLLLLIKSRNTKLSSYFTVGTFATYFLTGLLFYFGFIRYFKSWVSAIELKWNSTFIIVETVILTLLVFYFLKKIYGNKEEKKRDNLLINPLSIFLLSVGSTFADIPTALPYFIFIGKLEQSGLEIFSAVLYFLLYNLIYILPLLILLLGYSRNKEYFEIFFERIEILIDKIGTFILYFFIISTTAILALDIVFFICDLSTIWRYLYDLFK